MDQAISSDRLERPVTHLWYALPFAAALLLGGLLYGTTFSSWWWSWNETGSFYAHAMFVPIFVGMMVWRGRERLSAARWAPTWMGLIPLSLAVLLVILGKDSEVRMVQSISFMLMLTGAVLLLLGKQKTRVLRFPLLFVLTMIPLLPDQIINMVAFPIQMASTRLATYLLNLLLLPAKAEGSMIQMDNYKMMVGSACSGFRTLISLMTFAAAFAYLVEGATWKRWTLFLITAPMSLFINGLRIALIGVVGELISKRAASFFHDYSGLVTLLLAFWMLFGLARLLKCDNFLGIPLADEPEDSNAPQGPAWWQTVLAWRPGAYTLRRIFPYALALDGCLGIGLALQGHIFVTPVMLPPIATFQVPVTVSGSGGTYVAQPGPQYDKLDPVTEDALTPTRVINREYDGKDGSRMAFFMTAGNLRHTFHDPHNCSLGNDSVLTDVGIQTLQTSRGPVQMLESVFKQNGSDDRYEVIFCYVVDGRPMPTTSQIHRAIFWQTIAGSSGKPSYFLRFTQRVAGTNEVNRQQLLNFAKTMWESISPVLTGAVPAMPQAAPVMPSLHAD